MSLGCGKKSEHLEESHGIKKNIQTLHIEHPRSNLNLWALLAVPPTYSKHKYDEFAFYLSVMTLRNVVCIMHGIFMPLLLTR